MSELRFLSRIEQVAAQQHLARMGLIAPQDISLICDDPDSAFSWCDPPVSHMRWDSRPVVSRIIRWAGRVARGARGKGQKAAVHSRGVCEGRDDRSGPPDVTVERAGKFGRSRC